MANKLENKISASEFEKHFSEQLKDADNVYTKTLHRLARIRSSRQAHQKRQLKDLLINYKETDPRVIKQTGRIIREQEMESYTNILLDKNASDTEVIKDSYVLRGKVRGDSAKGLSGYSVQLQDARNNVIGKPVKTDVNGNYSIIVEMKEGVSINKLNIAVLDKQKTLIHSDKLPVLVKSDVVDTRDVLISSVDTVDRTRGRVLSESLLKTQPDSKVKVSPRTKKPDSPNKKIPKKAVKAVTKKITRRKINPKKPK